MVGTWYDAVTAQGAWIEGGHDLAELLRILVDEIMDPGDTEDVLILDGMRIVAVVSLPRGITLLGDAPWLSLAMVRRSLPACIQCRV